MSPTPKMKAILLTLLLVFFISTLCIYLYSFVIDYDYTVLESKNDEYSSLSVRNCAEHNAEVHRSDKDYYTHINNYVDLCTKMIRTDLSNIDYYIRKQKFIEQSRADTVIMWMVVIITASGVAMAGAQLITSIVIAVSTKNDLSENMANEVTIEKGKIQFKSSVTGALIMLMSLMFFYIYVLYVYSIYESGSGKGGIVDGSAVNNTPNPLQGLKNLGIGQLSKEQ